MALGLAYKNTVDREKIPSVLISCRSKIYIYLFHPLEEKSKQINVIKYKIPNTCQKQN